MESYVERWAREQKEKTEKVVKLEDEQNTRREGQTTTKAKPRKQKGKGNNSGTES